MKVDKRKGEKPVPENYKDYLTNEQLSSLRKIENFGWELKFIRRPLFLETLTVVVNPNGTSIGILEEDGRLNLDPDPAIIIRE